jgi:hypothetical protein
LITCTVLQPAAISGSQPTAATVTIFVAEAAATSQTAGMQRSILIAGIAPLSAFLLLPWANRRRRKLLYVLAVACVVSSLTGCSNPMGKAIGAPPISTEVVTLNAVAGSVTITTQLTVTVN